MHYCYDDAADIDCSSEKAALAIIVVDMIG